MEFQVILIVFITSMITGQCDAMLCHECSYQNFGLLGGVQGQFGCQDPFRSSGIAEVECSGKCYANSTKVEDAPFSFEAIYRGCATDGVVECDFFQGCSSIAEGTNICLYCCNDTAGCNSRSFAEVDQSIDKCWQCQAELNSDGSPADDNPCGRADFNGPLDDIEIGPDGHFILKTPCESGQCMSFILPPQTAGSKSTITRTCVAEGLKGICENPSFFEMFDVYESIECCTGSLCNVGSDFTPTVPSVTDGQGTPVTDVVLPIRCWECSGNLTSDGSTTCGSVDFNGFGEELNPCPTGECITLQSHVDETESTIRVVRTCAVDLLLEFCANPSLYVDLFGYVNIECCKEDRCITGTTGSTTTAETAATTIPSTTEQVKITTATTMKAEVTQKPDIPTTKSGARGIFTTIFSHYILGFGVTFLYVIYQNETI